MSPWLAAADVCVSAARNESFGLANLEALAAGLRVVAREHVLFSRYLESFDWQPVGLRPQAELRAFA